MMTGDEMKSVAWLGLLPILTACGPTEEEINNIAIITCNVMAESRQMDRAFRIKEINSAREAIGAKPYLGSGDEIIEAFEWGLCKELVWDDPLYAVTLAAKKEAKREQDRLDRLEVERRLALEAEERRVREERAKVEAEKKEAERIAREVEIWGDEQLVKKIEIASANYAICTACHGPEGGGGIGPKLSGQDATYIANRLRSYRNRETVGARSVLMWPMASELSNDDIDGLSVYISSFE